VLFDVRLQSGKTLFFKSAYSFIQSQKIPMDTRVSYKNQNSLHKSL